MSGFAKGGFNRPLNQNPLSAANPVPPEALPVIHEEATQSIQGGAAGDHYHLLLIELAFLQWALQEPVYYEPVMASSALVLDSTGDIIMTRGPDYVA